jgi:3-oxoacyl-[acyl-carrier-protein] synthase-3
LFRGLAKLRVNVPHAQIGPIAVHFPERTENCEQLELEHPEWHVPELTEKTGIRTRYLAAASETPSDLAFAACRRLFQEHSIDPGSIDFLLYCTQTPDYPLPTTACLLQDRLGLGIHCGALDFNLGCSGYVYGLSLAEGLICSGQAKRVLLVTAETYSKYIVAADRSLRPIFSDAAAATLIDAVEDPSLSGFVFGTDGKGANTLIVCDGGARSPQDAIAPRRRKRWGSRLYMDGPGLMDFTVGSIPQLVRNILGKADLSMEQIDLFLMHQATRKMLELLQVALGVDSERLPIRLEDRGNTVSSTLPILIEDLRREGRLAPGKIHLMVGFGVGWSWAGCVWKS